ncbi:F-box protein, partial [Shigella flexneri]|nr:F-box protein [Shigella flexneri]
MAMIERKEKMIERKTKEKEKEKQNQNIGNECSPWQTPPEDIMEKILQFIDFADQRRLGQVSKSWRSIVFQTFMRSSRRQ